MNTIGIDLGTTLSRMAVLDDVGRPKVIENAEGQFATPSIVFFGDEVVVGELAKRFGESDPARAVRYAKRYLGDEKSWEIDGAFYTPVDVSAFILRKLKNDFEARFGDVDRAVITVPAHFDARQRLLTVEAAQQAGLPYVDIVNEPVAAALAFILGLREPNHKEDDGQDAEYRQLAGMQKLLVYDLGGGTFDLSLVDYDNKVANVLASRGDLLLGGIDWNDRIVNRLAAAFIEEHGIDFRSDKNFLYHADDIAERAKHALSAAPRTPITATYQGKTCTIQFTRSDFLASAGDLVQRTVALTNQLLEDVNLRFNEVQSLLVVGGSTRMTMIQDAVNQMRYAIRPEYASGKFDPTRAVSPDFAIVQGAAHYAGLLQETQTHANFTATLATVHSLGLLVRNGAGELVNHVVIPRNAPLPAAHRLKVGTVKPDQRRISLRIVEGSGTTVKKDAICLCTLSNLPPNLPEGSLFDVSLMFETSGLLQVIARHLDSGLLTSVTVQRGPNAQLTAPNGKASEP